MVSFKLVIADPKIGKSYQVEIKGEDAEKLIGKQIGDRFRGELIGLKGYELAITGGSDREGFPMRKGIPGTKRVKVLLSRGPGFRPRRKGERKRKSVRGVIISEEIVQINCKVVKWGEQPIEKVLAKGETT
jgi:small subunit ribosomal protein S6e